MSKSFNISFCYRKVFEMLNKVSSVQDLVNRIAEFTEMDIVVTDISGKIMVASDENIIEDVKMLEKIVLEIYQKPENLSEIKIATIREGENPFAVSSFQVKGNEEGFVFVFTEDEEEAFQLNDIVRQAVGIVVERFGRRIHFHASTQRRLAAKAIFEHKEISREQREEAHLVGPFMMVILQQSELIADQMQRVENDMIDYYKHTFVYMSKGRMHVLFSDVHSAELEATLHNKVSELCEAYNMYCAVSSLFYELELLENKMFMLTETLNVAEKEKRITREYDLYMDVVCSCAVNKIGPSRYMEKKLQKMYEDDKLKGTEFYRSLKEYLLLRNNVSMTAKKLFIHRNTMIYRLAKVAEILGVDINEPFIANNLLVSMILQEAERRNS